MESYLPVNYMLRRYGELGKWVAYELRAWGLELVLLRYWILVRAIGI